MRKRWYIGCRNDFCLGDYSYEAFASAETPAKGVAPYMYVVGPFRTKRAALWAEKYGKRNPHFGCVGDAERLAKEEVKSCRATRSR